VIAIDIATRSVAPVSFPDGPTFMGFDGLYTGGENITAVVNSSTMDQIVHGRLARATDGKWTIVTSQSLERRHPAYEIPTTGALVGDTLFYVANSQLRRLDAKGNIRNPEIRTRTVILRLTLRAR